MTRQPKAALLERFAHLASDHGVALSPAGPDTLAGTLEISLGRWMIGGHSITYRCWCRLDETSRIVTFRESSTETSWGVPPPTVKLERHGPGGATAGADAGARHHGALREALEAAVRQAGWRFRFEPGAEP